MPMQTPPAPGERVIAIRRVVYHGNAIPYGAKSPPTFRSSASFTSWLLQKANLTSGMINSSTRPYALIREIPPNSQPPCNSSQHPGCRICSHLRVSRYSQSGAVCLEEYSGVLYFPLKTMVNRRMVIGIGSKELSATSSPADDKIHLY